jgi:hypothetical protein
MRYLYLLLIINAGGVIVLHLARCREIKAAPLGTPSSLIFVSARTNKRHHHLRSAIGSASTDSASSSSPTSRPLLNIPADGKSQSQRKKGLAGQQKLSTRAASFAGGRAELETSDLTSTLAKLTRQRSSREARRSRKDADGECLFEKINRDGVLVPLPRADPDDLTVHEKKLLKNIVDGQDRICPKTGKNWSNEWREQQEVWIQSAMNKPCQILNA